MRLNLNTLANADWQTLDLLSDTFQKKVGDWAFASHYQSSSAWLEEPYGRFSLQPTDAPVMSYVEEAMKDLTLPTGHLYEHALQTVVRDLQQDPEAQHVLAVLREDIALREYFRARQMEQVYS